MTLTNSRQLRSRGRDRHRSLHQVTSLVTKHYKLDRAADTSSHTPWPAVHTSPAGEYA